MNPFAPGTTKLGFIGLGLMGQRIAQRLLTHGYQVIAYDQDRSKVEKVIESGASPTANVAEIAASADVILSSLTDDEAVWQVYGGTKGLLSHVRQGCVIIEMSTVSPETPRGLHRIAAQRGASYLDVTISGSTPAKEVGWHELQFDRLKAGRQGRM